MQRWISTGWGGIAELGDVAEPPRPPRRFFSAKLDRDFHPSRQSRAGSTPRSSALSSASPRLRASPDPPSTNRSRSSPPPSVDSPRWRSSWWRTICVQEQLERECVTRGSKLGRIRTRGGRKELGGRLKDELGEMRVRGRVYESGWCHQMCWDVLDGSQMSSEQEDRCEGGGVVVSALL